MGTVCSECKSYEEEFGSIIQVSAANFAQVQAKPQLIEEIKQLVNIQLPEELKDKGFYLKGENCYFIGQITSNEQRNYGVLYKPQESLYCGNFSNGYFNGKGVLEFINKKITFDGQFNQGKPVQNGKITDKDKTFQFDGVWNNQFEPKAGVLKLFSNQLIEKIEFLDFARGNVEILYKNGSFYKGFVNKTSLLPQKIGKMTYASGNSYDGQWSQGKFQDTGTYTWSNGQYYNGEYKNGLRHGQGTLYFSQNKHFTGSWGNGLRQGFGTLIGKDGVILQKGIYINDRFDHEQSEQYLDKFMTKAPKDGLQSQLLNESKINQVSIEHIKQ